MKAIFLLSLLFTAVPASAMPRCSEPDFRAIHSILDQPEKFPIGLAPLSYEFRQIMEDKSYRKCVVAVNQDDLAVYLISAGNKRYEMQMLKNQNEVMSAHLQMRSN